MARKTIELNADNPMYQALVDEVTNASDDKLVIVARSGRNKKDDSIAPVGIRQGIYFYVALDLGDKLAFLGKVTPEQIEKAKKNTLERAEIGDMFAILLGDGESFKNWEYHGEGMIVVTSENKTNGAGILFCEEFFETMKAKIGGFTILPSSIHEIIIVPNSLEADMDTLTNMVRSVNAAEVGDDEYLADFAFKANEFFGRR